MSIQSNPANRAGRGSTVAGPASAADTLSAFESRLLRLAGSLMSRQGRATSLLVMIYHRVLPEPDPLLASEPDAASFSAQIGLIARHFNVLPLRDAVARLRNRTLPPRAVAITFDDGYANNCEVAAPILASWGAPATFFIATGYLNGGRMFNDTVIETMRAAPTELDLEPLGLGRYRLTDAASRIAAASSVILQLKYLPPEDRARRAEAIAASVGASLPNDLMMSDAQVQRVAGSGFEIGAHTVAHPILASVDEATAWREIIDSQRRLEELTGDPVRSFAYPNGRPQQDYRDAHVALVRKAGFELAVSTAWGAATAAGDCFQIPRIAPWDRSPRRYAARMLRAYRQTRCAVA